MAVPFPFFPCIHTVCNYLFGPGEHGSVYPLDMPWAFHANPCRYIKIIKKKDLRRKE